MSSQPEAPRVRTMRAAATISSLQVGRRLALAAVGEALLISFFAWYGTSISYTNGASFTDTIGATINAWHGWGIVAMILLLVAAVVCALPLAGTSVRTLAPQLPPRVTEPLIVMGLGALAALCIILYMVTESINLGQGSTTIGLSSGPALGSWVGLVCALIVIGAGYLMRNDGTPI
jgi:hypothetical protein